MENKNKLRCNIIMIILVSMFLIGFVNASTMIRTAPTTASGTFQLTYTTSSSDSMWGASIQEAVTGGCTFPSGSASYKTVMLSEDGLTKQVTITAPSSGSCTFLGDYKFGTDAIIAFPSLTVTIGTSSTCTPNWVTGSWSTCTSATQTRTETDSNSCGVTTGKPAISQSCTSASASTSTNTDSATSGTASAATSQGVSIWVYVLIIVVGLLIFYIIRKG